VTVAVQTTAHLRTALEGLPKSREIALAITKVEEAEHWLRAAQEKAQAGT
jgi:hypothetical protein